MKNLENYPSWITIEKAASIIERSVTTVNRHIERGTFTHRNHGGVTMIQTSTLANYIKFQQEVIQNKRERFARVKQPANLRPGARTLDPTPTSSVKTTSANVSVNQLVRLTSQTANVSIAPEGPRWYIVFNKTKKSVCGPYFGVSTKSDYGVVIRCHSEQDAKNRIDALRTQFSHMAVLAHK